MAANSTFKGFPKTYFMSDFIIYFFVFLKLVFLQKKSNDI